MKDRVPDAAVRPDDVAVIGVAGRFPRAASVEALWQCLLAAEDQISGFTLEELQRAGTRESLLADRNYVPRHGALRDIDRFDAELFGFSPREAELMDPQQRIFLECAWEALENAGYDPKRTDHPTGVFGGMSVSRYGDLVQADPANADPVWAFQAAIGINQDYLATRVSYRLNLTGPSLTVQTACSSSLLAIHLAGEALRRGECAMALAGGVSISPRQTSGYLYREGGVLSPEGRCRAFDAGANGIVPGSGVGVVVLKSLQRALDDDDYVYAVMRGSAVNNDGSLKIGFTAPSVEGQAAVITRALERAGVAPASVGYVEAHGTGTPLGDPIEMAALNEVFAGCARGSCATGSIKTNIGHLDAAAGVAGFIKAVLSLDREVIPATLHFEAPNPHIDFAAGPFHVNTGPLPWPRTVRPRRAGVSSFGIGGTNVHAVLEEAPARPRSGPAPGWHLLPLSNRRADGLGEACDRLARELERRPDLALSDAAFTLQVGRGAFAERAVVVASEADEARALLDAKQGGGWVAGRAGPPGDLVFLFPGQGAQHPGMGAGLYRSEPVFRREFDRCCEILHDEVGRDLRDLMRDAGDAGGDRVSETELAQPLIFAVEYALARTWMAWGIEPCAMIGHSLGEYVAACLAGTFSLSDALRVVAARGRLMQAMPRGEMLAVWMAEAELTPVLSRDLSLAAVNGPDLCVVSGTAEAVGDFAATVESRGVRVRRLRTSHAFHSALMDPVAGALEEVVAAADPRPPRVPFASNVTGEVIRPEEAASPLYWARHSREPVRFAQGLDAVARGRSPVYVEVGPGRTLEHLVRRASPSGAPPLVFGSLPHPDEDVPEARHLLTTVGRLWCAGAQIDWKRFREGKPGRRVPLPGYVFDRRSYWVRSPAGDDPGTAASTAPTPADAAGVRVLSWRRTADPARSPSPAHWLLFTDEDDLGAALAGRLAGAGACISHIRRGWRLDTGDREVRAGDENGGDAALVDAVVRGSEPPRGVIYLWGLRRGDAGRMGDLRRFIRFVRAMEERACEPARVFVITAGACDVTGAEALDPPAAAVLGAAAGASSAERTPVRCIDLPLGDPADGACGRVLGQVEAEVLGSGEEPVVAYRGAHRWVRLWDAPPPAGADAARRAPGAFLLANVGTGPVWSWAEGLARAPGQRFVVVPRAVPDAAGSRPPAHDGAAGLRAGVEQLRAAGAEVLVQDGAGPHAIDAAVREACSRWGGLDGVLHEAWTDVDPEDRTEPEAACIRATLQAARDHALEFCAVLGVARPDSSGPATTGAGEWLECLVAEHNRMARTPCRTLVYEHPPAAGGERPWMPALAGRAVAHYRLAPAVHALPPPWLEESPALQAGSTAGADAPAQDGSDEGAAALVSEIEQRVAEVWTTVLGAAPIQRTDNFFDLGGHSLFGLQIVSRLREEFQVDIPVRAVFSSPTVAELSEVLFRLLLADVDAPLEGDHPGEA